MTLKEAQAFIGKWGAVLCPEWEIKVVDGPSPHWAANDHQAATTAAGGGDYLRATIHVHEVTGGIDDADAERQTLFHELLHLTLNDLELAAKEPANRLGEDGCTMAKRTIDRYVERTVDRLASAFAASTSD